MADKELRTLDEMLTSLEILSTWDKPFTKCSATGKLYSECSSCEHFRCTADDPQADLIKRSDAVDAIENVDWYHQNRNKDMVSGANSDEHQAWYKADDIYEALETVPSINRKE